MKKIVVGFCLCLLSPFTWSEFDDPDFDKTIDEMHVSFSKLTPLSQDGIQKVRDYVGEIRKRIQKEGADIMRVFGVEAYNRRDEAYRAKQKPFIDHIQKAKIAIQSFTRQILGMKYEESGWIYGGGWRIGLTAHKGRWGESEDTTWSTYFKENPAFDPFMRVDARLIHTHYWLNPALTNLICPFTHYDENEAGEPVLNTEKTDVLRKKLFADTGHELQQIKEIEEFYGKLVALEKKWSIPESGLADIEKKLFAPTPPSEAVPATAAPAATAAALAGGQEEQVVEAKAASAEGEPATLEPSEVVPAEAGAAPAKQGPAPGGKRKYRKSRR